MPLPALRFVIVDDHPVFRQVARELLEERGYAVAGEADSAAAAQSVVGRCRPDIVIVDVRLGDESGFDVARELTGSHPSLVVVLVSTDPELNDPRRVTQSGARAFLPKTRLATADLVGLLRASAGRFPGALATVRPWRWRPGPAGGTY
jgi:DNA-binding NarL/FixJ family response regulator